jgi:hypothetical protein
MKWGFGYSVVFSTLAVLFAMPSFAQLNAGATRPQVPLPEGPLRNIILKNCVSCHGIDDYAYHALEKDKWTELLTNLHQGMNVKLADNDEALLLEYLATTFGTESAPFPRKYIPAEITTFYTDVEGRRDLDVICTECHELDRVYETRASLARSASAAVSASYRELYS